MTSKSSRGNDLGHHTFTVKKLENYAMTRILCSTRKCDENVLVYDSANLNKKYSKRSMKDSGYN